MTTPGLPPLFGAPWEREAEADRERMAQARAIPFDTGEAALNQMRRELADAIRQMNPPEYERRSSGSEWVGAVPRERQIQAGRDAARKAKEANHLLAEAHDLVKAMGVEYAGDEAATARDLSAKAMSTVRLLVNALEDEVSRLRATR